MLYHARNWFESISRLEFFRCHVNSSTLPTKFFLFPSLPFRMNLFFLKLHNTCFLSNVFEWCVGQRSTQVSRKFSPLVSSINTLKGNTLMINLNHLTILNLSEEMSARLSYFHPSTSTVVRGGVSIVIIVAISRSCREIPIS